MKINLKVGLLSGFIISMSIASIIIWVGYWLGSPHIWKMIMMACPPIFVIFTVIFGAVFDD